MGRGGFLFGAKQEKGGGVLVWPQRRRGGGFLFGAKQEGGGVLVWPQTRRGGGGFLFGPKQEGGGGSCSGPKKNPPHPAIGAICIVGGSWKIRGYTI